MCLKQATMVLGIFSPAFLENQAKLPWYLGEKIVTSTLIRKRSVQRVTNDCFVQTSKERFVLELESVEDWNHSIGAVWFLALRIAMISQGNEVEVWNHYSCFGRIICWFSRRSDERILDQPSLAFTIYKSISVYQGGASFQIRNQRKEWFPWLGWTGLVKHLFLLSLSYFCSPASSSRSAIERVQVSIGQLVSLFLGPILLYLLSPSFLVLALGFALFSMSLGPSKC